jgi:hypothetical protein
MAAAAEPPDVCVAHLVWKPLGVEVFEAFVDSYRGHRAGIGHELVLVFKDFSFGDERKEYTTLVEDVPHRPHEVSGDGYDITAYFAVAQELGHRYLCFLNSYSRVVADDWLAMLHGQIDQPGVGLVGASGSFESPLEGHLRHVARVRYGRRPSGLRRRLADRRLATSLERDFEPFPNPHVRTNGFMLERTAMLDLRFGGEQTKLDSLRFESGKESMTRQVLGRGLDVRIVGRDGEGYAIGRWPESRTFRAGDQENLLIADNRTRQYQQAPPARRAQLRRNTWGA